VKIAVHMMPFNSFINPFHAATNSVQNLKFIASFGISEVEYFLLFLPLLFYVEVQVCEFILAFIILIENFKEGTIN
jgi:hypothetical protein